MSSPPDLGALYLKHRDAMYRVAASVLREVGRASEAEDAVQEAIVSILRSPPKHVENWEAFLVSTVKRRAVDRVRSADVRHSGPELDTDLNTPDLDSDVAQDVAESVDRQREAAIAWDSLSVLDERYRKAVWDVVARERPRSQVAAELQVNPSRVSQLVAEGLRKIKDEMSRKEGER